jgi:hypothetical protein
MIEAARDAMGLMVNPIHALLFRPRSIAVIGATDKPPERGASVVANLMMNAGCATVYLVNPQHATPSALPEELAPDRACCPRRVRTGAGRRAEGPHRRGSQRPRRRPSMQQESFGFPVAVKLRSDTALHKADVAASLTRQNLLLRYWHERNRSPRFLAVDLV